MSVPSLLEGFISVLLLQFFQLLKWQYIVPDRTLSPYRQNHHWWNSCHKFHEQNINQLIL